MLYNPKVKDTIELQSFQWILPLIPFNSEDAKLKANGSFGISWDLQSLGLET